MRWREAERLLRRAMDKGHEIDPQSLHCDGCGKEIGETRAQCAGRPVRTRVVKNAFGRGYRVQERVTSKGHYIELPDLYAGREAAERAAQDIERDIGKKGCC